MTRPPGTYTDGGRYERKPTIPFLTQKRKVLLAIIAVEAVVLAGLVIVSRTFFPPKFRTVEDGVLYRSGQPAGRQWWVLKHKNIRTVVNLRVREEDQDAFDRERELCREAGVEHVSIMCGMYVPDEEQIAQFLRIVRAGPPVLVHCQHGRDRAGQMAAAYRIVVQGWSARSAYDEWLRLASPTDRRRVDTRELLQNLERSREPWRVRIRRSDAAETEPAR